MLRFEFVPLQRSTPFSGGKWIIFFENIAGKTGVAFVRSASAGRLQKFLIAIPGETGSRQFREVKLEMLREM